MFPTVVHHVPVFFWMDVFNKFTEHVPAWICYTSAQHGFDSVSHLAAPRPDRRRSEEMTCKVSVYQCAVHWSWTNNPVRPVRANVYCCIAKSVSNRETNGLDKGQIWLISHDTWSASSY